MLPPPTRRSAPCVVWSRKSVGCLISLVLWLGAKLGAIPCGIVWTPVDVGGPESRSAKRGWTVLDVCGHRLEIYGSEGWGFKSSRARQAKSGLRGCRSFAGGMPWEHSREPSTGPSGHQRVDVVGGIVAVSLGHLFSTGPEGWGSSFSGRAAKDLVEVWFCLLRGGVSARNG
jgi:hypothetical protein